jgi:hypothetical protein
MVARNVENSAIYTNRRRAEQRLPPAVIRYDR